MDIHDWDERYRSGMRPAEDREARPTPLLIDTANRLRPGRALDLACGTGRNALWLAENGWRVTAVDGSPAAIGILKQRAAASAVDVDARIADLEKGEYRIEPSTQDLIIICYYLQRDLFEPAKRGLVAGGLLLASAHIAEPGEEPTYKRLRRGELESYFQGWDILHRYEGKSNDPAHRRPVAEIVARKADTRRVDCCQSIPQKVC
jgi:SAM-dependent methyltransferase